MTLSAVVCTHAPRRDHLDATVAALVAQERLPAGSELLLVDNAGATPLADLVDVSRRGAFASVRIVREPRLGLVHARTRGIRETSGDVIVFIDDDNILAPDYLAGAADAFTADATLGAAGGRSIPRYEAEPPAWFRALGISLACRDLGEDALYADWSTGRRSYPACAPIGAGMAVRRAALSSWVTAVSADECGQASLGRCGGDLASGEDNDMVLTMLGEGWRVAYLPQLSLDHLIPASRLTEDYVARYVESSNRTWVQVLAIHGIRPWPAIPAWTVPARRLKAYVTNRAWRGPVNRIRWRGACGLFAGQSRLAGMPKAAPSEARPGGTPHHRHRPSRSCPAGRR